MISLAYSPFVLYFCRRVHIDQGIFRYKRIKNIMIDH